MSAKWSEKKRTVEVAAFRKRMHETEDGALLYLTFQGIRHGPPDVIATLGRGEPVDPARYYFRSVAQFETPAPKYQFLNKILAIGSGEIRNGKPIHTFEEVV